MNRKAVLVTAIVLLGPSQLAGQTPSVPPTVQVNGVELTLSGRVHTQLSTTDVPLQSPSELFIRRARLGVSVRVDDRVSGTVQSDFAGDEVSLKDAYLNLAFSPGVQLRAGHAHRPFGLLEQTSSTRMLPIERGLRIRGLPAADEYALVSGLNYSNRDIGLQLHGQPRDAPLGFSYATGVSRGPLHGQVGDQHSYQVAARATIRPAAALRVGAGWSNRHFASRFGETAELRRGNAFEVDLEYGSFAPGFHLLAEISGGDYDPFADATFLGAHTWLGYRTAPLGGLDVSLEPILRASYSDVDAGISPLSALGGTLITPGINVYLTPLNRVMLNYDLWFGDDDGQDARSLKAMFQLAF